jgi:hypothetical protein
MDLFTNKSNTKCNTKSDIKTAITSAAYNTKSRAKYSIKNWRPAAILASILFLMPCLALSASSKKKQDSGEERWFEVELIVFAHNNKLALDSEKWPEITDLVLPEEMVELGQPIPKPPEEITPTKDQQDLVFEQVTQDGSSPIEDLKPIPMPVAFVMLRDEELQLKESLKKLTKSSKFDPLLHIAWRQPNKNLKTEKTARKTKSDINNETNIEMINPRFAGTIRLSVARYLHFAADLVYRAPITQRVANPMRDRELWTDSPYQALSYPQGPAYQLESWKALRGFRLEESRRMRSKRIHYLDHPFLGIVVLITPVELPKGPEELSTIDPTNNISSGN